MSPPATTPELFAIFHRRFVGDDALLRLAQAELEQAGIGAEVYPGTMEEALHDWQLVPRGVERHMVHLPRKWDIFLPETRARIVNIALALRGRVRGLVFHDRADWPSRLDELATALGEINAKLGEMVEGPILHLEYAAGLTPEAYETVLERLLSLGTVSACIDTGHVTVFSAVRWMRTRFPHFHPRELAPDDPALASIVRELPAASRHAVQDLVGLVDRIASLGKPMHFHLHDAHLLSQLNPGLSDHLSFDERIPVSPALSPEGTLPTILGIDGLRAVLAAVRARLPTEDISLTLEIHPTVLLARKPLGERATLFTHWNDLTQAELTHQWLDRMVDQAHLVRRLWNEGMA